MIEHLETVHEEENKGWNKRNLAPTNSSDGKHLTLLPGQVKNLKRCPQANLTL